MTEKLENTEPFAEIPEELKADIKTLFNTRSDIPQTVDDAIIADARRYLVQEQRRFGILKWGAPLAAAAGLIVILLTVYTGRETTIPDSAKSLAATHRHITILDAFSVARAIQAGEPVREEWDVNHDGTVDQGDVNGLITLAVRL